MAYTREEMETVCRYDYVENKWIVYTNVQKHITKLTKIAGEPNKPEYDTNQKGETRLISGQWVLNRSQVRFAKLMERITANEADSEEENEDEHDYLSFQHEEEGQE